MTTRSGDWITLHGVVVPGHRVASGQATTSPYRAGTIAMQAPFFRDRGVDLSPFFLGTLNVSIHPYCFEVNHPSHCFRNVKWSPAHAAEDFSFCRSRVQVDYSIYTGWLYYPHPETKLGHFQEPSTVELLVPKIPDIHYGDRLTVQLSSQEVSVAKLTDRS
ncbi:MAG: hypothetical protein IGR76_08520 [Synechococcales cyanobacterium T60_A2020_003]|nr:hypothetical protein [Synechococcales cyanobacterium T60_A2020_003]